MDGIGFMERDARLFQARVLALLDGPCPVPGVIKAPAPKRCKCFLNCSSGEDFPLLY